MKKLAAITIPVVILATSMAIMIACGEEVQISVCEVCGEYFNEDNPKDYLLINEDGSYSQRELGIGTDGKWEVHEGIILFIRYGISTEGEIIGNRLIDANGKVWFKEATPTITHIPTHTPSSTHTPSRTPGLALDLRDMHNAANAYAREALEWPTANGKLPYPGERALIDFSASFQRNGETVSFYPHFIAQLPKHWDEGAWLIDSAARVVLVGIDPEDY